MEELPVSLHFNQRLNMKSTTGMKAIVCYEPTLGESNRELSEDDEES